MDRYVVIGHPVEHSRSPAIHARFAALTGQTLVYERLLAPLDGFTATVQDFAAAGGRGCNITVPFKFEAWQLAARRTPRAELAQAANTLRFDAEADGGWWCDNTDGAGLVRDLTVNAGVALAGQRVLLIGAGGAAAGVLGPLIEARPAGIVIANRTAQKAECGSGCRGGSTSISCRAAWARPARPACRRAASSRRCAARPTSSPAAAPSSCRGCG